MWTQKSSWLQWMDYLESIGGNCDGPEYCKNYGDITIKEGLVRAKDDPDFSHTWVLWVFDHSPPLTTSRDVRIGMINLMSSKPDDCAIARCRKIFLRHKDALSRSEKNALLKTVFRDDIKRHADMDPFRQEVLKNG